MKILTIHLLFLLLLLGSATNAHAATDILDIPAPSLLPVEEKGMAWEHPEATVSGVGELKMEDGTGVGRYEGEIRRDVSASAGVDAKNKVDIRADANGLEVEAKSKIALFWISNCTVIESSGAVYEINESTMMSGKVKVDIEGLMEDGMGTLSFRNMRSKERWETARVSN